EDSEVWEFLGHYGCKSNPLYQCGKRRIGCIGCPMNTGTRPKELHEYPKYRAAYVRAFDRMLEERTRRGKDNRTWHNGEDVMAWWLGDDPNQLTFDKYLDDEYQDAIEQWEWEASHKL
ncbi:MAG: hypothetical protein IKS88_03855, partial [Clostridia bacterium]|nr:hypothetical protein [Clostridia bacterium]